MSLLTLINESNEDIILRKGEYMEIFGEETTQKIMTKREKLFVIESTNKAEYYDR